jgi:O-acetylhomoserine (thiol)-lyase
VTGARAVPIYQTTSYVFRDTDQAAALFNLERAGHIYSRISNPTVAVLEERIAALEHGLGRHRHRLRPRGAASRGRHADGPGRPHRRLVVALRRLDQPLHPHPAALRHHHDLRAAARRRGVPPRRSARRRAWSSPRALGNPGLEVLDIPAVAEVAHAAGIPLLIDSTFATPWLCRPIELGADLVLHSATKWLGGHGLAIGGLLVDGGRFDWEASGKFATLTEPYEGYHGIDFAEEFGPQAFAMRARSEGLRDFGAAMAPQNAFYILQGVETLPLRMERTWPTPTRCSTS